MSAVVFDSTVLVAHLRGVGEATELLAATPRSRRLVSVLSRVEIEGGMRARERTAVARLFGIVTLVPVSDAIARLAGEHLRRFRRSHGGIDVVDYVIAATAGLLEADLATLNVRHFPMIKGLRPPW